MSQSNAQAPDTKRQIQEWKGEFGLWTVSKILYELIVNGLGGLGTEGVWD